MPTAARPLGATEKHGNSPQWPEELKVQQVKGPGSDRPEGLPRTCWLPDVSSSFLRCGLRAGDSIWRGLSWTLSGLCVSFYPHLAWRRVTLGVRSPLVAWGGTRVPLLASSALGCSCGGDRGSVQCVRLGRPGGAGLRCTSAPPVSRTQVAAWAKALGERQRAAVTGAYPAPLRTSALCGPAQAPVWGLLTSGSHCPFRLMHPGLRMCPPHPPGVLSLQLRVLWLRSPSSREASAGLGGCLPSEPRLVSLLSGLASHFWFSFLLIISESCPHRAPRISTVSEMSLPAAGEAKVT